MATTMKSTNDIRNFLKKPSPVNGSFSKPVTSGQGQVRSHVHSFNNSSVKNSSPSVAKPLVTDSAVNRVVGFSDLSSNSGNGGVKGKHVNSFGGKGNVLGKGTANPSVRSPFNNVRKGFGRGGGGMLANRGGGTLVVTGSQTKARPTEKPESPNQKLRVDDFKPFFGSGYSLGGPSQSKDRSKSRLLSNGQEPQEKKMKIDGVRNHVRSSEVIVDHDNPDFELKKCPVCNEKFPREEMDLHFESCFGLQNVFSDSSTPDPCDDTEISEINDKYKIVSCPVCAMNFEGDINTHLDECLNSSGILNVFEESPIELSDSDISPVKFLNDVPRPRVNTNDDLEFVPNLEVTVNNNMQFIPKPKITMSDDVQFIEPEEPERRVACPLCGMRFGESRINSHVNQCIDEISDQFD